MDAIEKAIRSAFEKGDPSERAFREKVYRSAFAALEKSLQANPNVTQAIADRRRQALSAAVSDIESEFIPAVAATGPVKAASPQPKVQRREPSFDERPAPRPRPERLAPQLDDRIEPPAFEPYDTPQRSRRPWPALLATAALLVLLGLGAWWLFAPGAPVLQFPPPVLEDEDFQPEAAGEPPSVFSADDLEDWITIFEPADPTTVSTPGDSQAAVMQDDDAQFIRIHAGASGTPVLFDVGQGVLEQVAGKRAVFNIVARTEEGGATPISVDCSLGELGDCGRKRYHVGITREDLLFVVDLPSVDPGSGGTIAINPDIENTGRSVDIFAIRVSPAE